MIDKDFSLTKCSKNVEVIFVVVVTQRNKRSCSDESRAFSIAQLKRDLFSDYCSPLSPMRRQKAANSSGNTVTRLSQRGSVLKTVRELRWSLRMGNKESCLDTH